METLRRRTALVPAAIALAMTMLGGACQDDQVPTAAPGSTSSDLTPLVPDTQSADADGATIVALTIAILKDSKLQPRLIAFSTTTGTFLTSGNAALTVTADDTGGAKVFLRAPTTPGTAFIRASAGGSTRNVSVKFEVAFPETIAIEPSQFQVQADTAQGSQEITISAFLRRPSGVVTRGQEVTFVASKAGAAEPRIGVAALSDSTGLVKVKYAAGPTNYRGPVTITATTLGKNKVLTASTTIDIIARTQ